MINNVNPFSLTTQPIQVQQKTNVLNTNSNTSKPSFADALKKSIEQINQSQIESDKMTEALATGKNVELHDVMISAQKASVTMSLAVEVRNKAIEAYQEMMRMQV
ncbi:flagellar hook-basal body complex protein FliE [Metabacillus sediminilitoris]|uniref:Flagellar hook-basal body complex protein FliE n=1 Tax=Metabacillus sediminilitoris TaxID=2567941 RepID=A0A4S4C5A9_9BACI|nr:flagellar hook-basal body complex protein FliE [Metabacillus sediminilitoris]QGQ46861.1 flagellar hook-basal body complex protein FliE [Metabacillus sediminilitoris]THF83009.1 flagellar hook-basal body complex protein FliE [Metabacillus sediminilitoris]